MTELTGRLMPSTVFSLKQYILIQLTMVGQNEKIVKKVKVGKKVIISTK